MTGVGQRRWRQRRRSDPEAVLRRFTAGLGPDLPTEELLLRLAEALRAHLRSANVEIWIDRGPAVICAVAVPHASEGQQVELRSEDRHVLREPGVFGPAWVGVWLPGVLAERTPSSLRLASIVNEGDPFGWLVVERDRADDFSAAEESVLAELARHIGLVLRNERLDSELQVTLDQVRRTNAELRASRARIVESADAERRRIERDLHDGAQQSLIAAAFELRRARNALETDSAKAPGLLDRAQDTLAEAVQQLSDLAHGIYPPLLLDAGLSAAIRAAAERHPSPVRVDAADVGRHDTAIEAAVYFSILEALQNAAKHAAGADVRITLTDASDELIFEVDDDGPGFDPDLAQHGHGTLNILDRIGAIGGSVEWDSCPGSGATMRGRVPTGTDRPGR